MTNYTYDRQVRRVGARRIGRWEVRRTPVRRYAANFFQETTMTPDCQKNTDGCGLFFVEPAAPCEKKTIKCDCGTDLFFGGIAQGGLEGDRLEPGKPGWSGQTGAGGTAAKGKHADHSTDRGPVADGQPKKCWPQAERLEKIK